MQQYDRYPYNDDYNGNSVFERQSSGDLGSVIILALFLGFWLVIEYIYKEYPIIGLIISILYLIGMIYVFYRIIRFIYRAIKKLFRGKKASCETIRKQRVKH